MAAAADLHGGYCKILIAITIFLIAYRR